MRTSRLKLSDFRTSEKTGDGSVISVINMGKALNAPFLISKT